MHSYKRRQVYNACREKQGTGSGQSWEGRPLGLEEVGDYTWLMGDEWLRVVAQAFGRDWEGLWEVGPQRWVGARVEVLSHARLRSQDFI